MTPQGDLPYTSPARKLIRFFRNSRDQWKTKYQSAKTTIKRQENRVRYLEQSKAQWKHRAQSLEAEVSHLRAQLQRQKATLPAPIEKNDGCVGPWVAPFLQAPARHHYGLDLIYLFIALVGASATSFRGASRCTELFCAVFHLPETVPSWSTGRLWWLRLGYYKLTRPQPKGEDWVWIVDHTVQLGAQKCLVILGLRLRDLPPRGQVLTHQQVEPLTLVPVEQSNGEVVYQQLEATQARTGVPRQILSDHGTDLNAGITRYCQGHPQTCAIYDIKHKTAALLKAELHHEGSWQTFTHYASALRKELQQTPLAALAPPNQRSKARYMNLHPLIRWCRQAIGLLDQPERVVACGIDPQQMADKLIGLPWFGRYLPEWETLLSLAETTEDFVRRQGLYQDASDVLEGQLLLACPTQRTQHMRQNLLDFVALESQKARPDERLLGSSEIIESVLGKFKTLEGNYACRGFTGLVLSVAALVSTTTQEVIRSALETVPTRMIRGWFDENLGKSLQAQRKALFQTANISEQKPDQLNNVA